MRISRGVYAQAAAVAADLKRYFEQRLKDKPHPRRCRHKPGPATVMEILLPADKSHIARGWCWSCRMRNDTGETWEEELECCIPWWELYPMFRNAFAGIAVEVDHSLATLYHDAEPHLQEEEMGRGFTPSGRTVVVRDEQSVYVRPSGDPKDSVWLDAEICIVTDPRHIDRGEAPLGATCNVDPFALGQSRARVETGGYYYMQLSKQPTFYVSKNYCPRSFAPIARLVAFDEATKEATFELDQSVEAFVPAAKKPELNWPLEAILNLLAIGMALLTLLVGFTVSMMAAHFCIICGLMGALLGIGVNVLAKKTPLGILVGASLMVLLPWLLLPGPAAVALVVTIFALIFTWAGFFIGVALKLE